MQGDNRDTLKTLADNSVDAIVTDPPYGIDFLGKDWDANTGALETYKECLRVLKPGGHILAFSAARTYHHLAITLEQAGFEIRDQLMWLYSSGFPKAQDIGKAIQKRQGVEETNTVKGGARPSDKMVYRYAEENEYTETVCTSPEAQQWAGWKTALKPAHEPICMARKPFKGSTIDNVLIHGVGALNIDATRITTDDVMISSQKSDSVYANFSPENRENKDGARDGKENEMWQQHEQGRFPSNVIGEVAEEYQKYFYCPKVSRKERHIGFDTTNIPTDSSDYQGSSNGGNYIEKKQNILTNADMIKEMDGYYLDDNGERTDESNNKIWLPHTKAIYAHGLKEAYSQWCEMNGKTPTNTGNNHPTVKPVELMKYLIKLVTPPNSTVLDPFTGSGSTGMAAVELGHTFIGCELDPNYVQIANTRIAAWNTVETNNNYESLFEECH